MVAEKLVAPGLAFPARGGLLPARLHAQSGGQPDAAAVLCTPGAGRFAERSCAAQAAGAVQRTQAARDAAPQAEPEAVEPRKPKPKSVERRASELMPVAEAQGGAQRSPEPT